MRLAAVMFSSTCALLGCAYRPGSFNHGTGSERWFVGQQATVGCLDVSVQRRADLDGSVVLAYRFGNRCNQSVEVDLLNVSVVGRLAGGGERMLTPYDPRFELRPVTLDGRRSGGEALAYPASEPVTQVCVDVASLVRAQPARWLCFASEAAAQLAEVSP